VIVVDTGVLLAVGDDAHHDRCDALLGSYSRSELRVPAPVIVETSWLIEDRLGAAGEAAFLRSVVSGELSCTDLDGSDWERVVELVET
jgi:predicted nucleic acid-binding protein